MYSWHKNSSNFAFSLKCGFICSKLTVEMQDGNTVTPTEPTSQATEGQTTVQPAEGGRSLAQRFKEKTSQLMGGSGQVNAEPQETPAEGPKELAALEDIKPADTANVGPKAAQKQQEAKPEPTPREHKIEDDIRMLSSFGKSKDEIDAYVSAITPVDLSEYNAEQMAAVYARYKLPESYSDEQVQSYLSEKFGDNKAALTDYAEAGRAEMTKELSDARKEAIDSLAEMREKYYSEEDAYQRIEEYSKSMQKSYTDAIQGDSLEVNGAILNKKHLSHIHESIKDDIDSGNMLGMLFVKQDGTVDMPKYIDALMRYAPEKLSPKLVESYKKATMQKDLVQAQKQNHVDRVNMPSSRGEAPRRTHTGEKAEALSPTEVRKKVMNLRKKGGRLIQ